MKKIEKLTGKQRANLKVWRETWIDIGLKTGPADRDEAKEAIAMVYQSAKLEAPANIFFARGPREAAEWGAKMQAKGVTPEPWNIGYKPSESEVKEHYVKMIYGSHDAGWLSFYDFFNENTTANGGKRLAGLIRLAKCAGWCSVYTNVAIIQDRPVELHRKEKKLHCETGPAVSYADGTEVYALNGVRMDKKWVMTPAEKIDPKEVLGIENVEIRREMIRKIGVERLLQAAGGKVLDKEGKYELISIDLSDEITDCRYLKMENPSIGVWHVEGVHPDCDTVQQANNWRAGDIDQDWKPNQLT